MTGRRPIIAIDGPAGAGKSTIARKVAERLGYSITLTVPDGIREIIGAFEEGRFEDAFDGRYRNIA